MEKSLSPQAAKIRTFFDLVAWKEAHNLLLMIYRHTDSFPQKEMYKLTNQLRAASVSITSNIAEGFGRKSYKEKLNFYCVARGSLTEVQNQLFISKGVEYLTEEKFQIIFEKSVHVSKLLNGLIKKTRSIVRENS